MGTGELLLLFGFLISITNAGNTTTDKTYTQISLDELLKLGKEELNKEMFHLDYLDYGPELKLPDTGPKITFDDQTSFQKWDHAKSTVIDSMTETSTLSAKTALRILNTLRRTTGLLKPLDLELIMLVKRIMRNAVFYGRYAKEISRILNHIWIQFNRIV